MLRIEFLSVLSLTAYHLLFTSYYLTVLPSYCLIYLKPYFYVF